MLNALRLGFAGLCLLVTVGCTITTSGGVNTTVGTATPAATTKTSSTPAATPSSATTPANAGDLAVDDFKFTQGKDGPTLDGDTFKAGEDIFMAYEIKGFKSNSEGEAWVQGDLQLLGADDKVIVSKENLFDVHGKSEGATSMSGKNTFEVTKGSPAGDYKLRIVVRDKVASTTTTFTKQIKVEGEAH